MNTEQQNEPINFDNMEKKPFDLQKALNGARLITDSGLEATQFKQRDANLICSYPYKCIVNGNWEWYTDEGCYSDAEADPSPLDLFILE